MRSSGLPCGRSMHVCVCLFACSRVCVYVREFLLPVADIVFSCKISPKNLLSW